MSISVLPECVYVNHMCGRCLQESEEDVVSPGTGMCVLESHHVGAGN